MGGGASLHRKKAFKVEILEELPLICKAHFMEYLQFFYDLSLN